MINYAVFKLDWGWVFIAVSEKGICNICLPRKSKTAATDQLNKVLKKDWQENSKHPLIQKTLEQVTDYFSGSRTQFDLPIDLSRGTDFRQKVWQHTAKIPYGQTRSYGWLAEKAGSPKASRAVGGAMSSNPIPPVVPCHRVLGSDRSLTGFGGGLPLKEKMLQMEGYEIN